MNNLKVIVSKIEAHRPNVLLVEKSVSSYAQEYLLEKEISLVLNVKRPVLERIARCTGALITPSVDKISVARLGHCELFRLERVFEALEAANQFNKRPSKTLMYFEGCPRRLGCTVMFSTYLASHFALRLECIFIFFHVTNFTCLLVLFNLSGYIVRFSCFYLIWQFAFSNYFLKYHAKKVCCKFLKRESMFFSASSEDSCPWYSISDIETPTFTFSNYFFSNM